MTLCCDSVIFIFFVHFSYFVVFCFFVCLKFGVRKFNTNIFMFYLSFLVTSWRLFTLFLGKVQKQLPKVFFKKAVLNNFSKFTRKHLCRNFCFDKIPALRLATLLKKRTPTQVFSSEFGETFKVFPLFTLNKYCNKF